MQIFFAEPKNEILFFKMKISIIFCLHIIKKAPHQKNHLSFLMCRVVRQIHSSQSPLPYSLLLFIMLLIFFSFVTFFLCSPVFFKQCFIITANLIIILYRYQLLLIISFFGYPFRYAFCCSAHIIEKINTGSSSSSSSCFLLRLRLKIQNMM